MVSLHISMAQLGFIIVATGYTHEKIVQGHGTPYGASSVSGQNSAPPTPEDLEVARHQGARVSQVAAALSPPSRNHLIANISGLVCDTLRLREVDHLLARLNSVAVSANNNGR